jgi:uncharacterized protein
VADDDPFVSLLVDFARVLRVEGLPVGSGDVLTYCTAMAPLDPTDLTDLYWAGRTTLVTRRDSIPVYDQAFGRFFLDEGDDLPEPLQLTIRATAQLQSVLQVPATEPRREGRDEEEVRLGLVASDSEVLRNKAFAGCTPDELAAIRRIIARIRLQPPRRRTRRTTPTRAGRGVPDLRRTVRESMRMHGEPSTLFWRRRRMRLRPLILILDVSGSMADYSRNLLQFAYSVRRASTRVEVF